MTTRPVLRRAAIAAGFALGAGVIAWSFLSMYGPGPGKDPWRASLIPARRLLQAGLAQDSAALAGMDLAPGVAEWALDAGRRHPAYYRMLEQGLEYDGGQHRGDRSLAYFRAPGLLACHRSPLIIAFAGPVSSARIEEVIAPCDTLPVPP